MIKKIACLIMMIWLATTGAVFASGNAWPFECPGEYKGDIGIRCQLQIKTNQNGAKIDVGTYRGGNDCVLWLKSSALEEVEEGVFEGEANGQMKYGKRSVNAKLRFEQNEDGSFSVYQQGGTVSLLKSGECVVVYP